MNQPNTTTPPRLNFNLEFGPASEVSLTVVDLPRDTWLGQRVAHLVSELVRPVQLIMIDAPPFPTGAECSELADLREQLKHAKDEAEAAHYRHRLASQSEKIAIQHLTKALGIDSDALLDTVVQKACNAIRDSRHAQARLIEALGEVDDPAHFESIIDQVVEVIGDRNAAWAAMTRALKALKGALGTDDPFMDTSVILDRACHAIRDREAVLKLNGELQTSLKEAELASAEADHGYRREKAAREAAEAEAERLRHLLDRARLGNYVHVAEADPRAATPDVAPATPEPTAEPDPAPTPSTASAGAADDEPTHIELEHEVEALIDAWFDDASNKGPCVLTTLTVLESLDVDADQALRSRVGYAINAVVDRRKLLVTRRAPSHRERKASEDRGTRYEIRRNRPDDSAAAKARRTPGLR